MVAEFKILLKFIENKIQMKNAITSLCLLLLFSAGSQAQTKTNRNDQTNKTKMSQSVYQFKVEDLNGKEFDFASLKGKKILIVNTASKCGLTPQYKDLEAIYKKYKDNNFTIIGFPANNFASQEPGTNEEIEAFCQLNYGVTFPMMSKISVKGNDMAKIYQFLTQKSLNGVQDSEVEWNFQKYLINEEGHLEKVISPKILPTDESIVKWIQS